MINKEIKNMTIVSAGLTAAATAAGLFVSPLTAVFTAVLGTLLLGTFVVYTKIRYQRLEKLNQYLSMVLSGEYDMELMENEEGEISLLQNNLYKVTVLLKTQNEKLEADKKYLADALADISHQLKTPLTSMMMMTDLLQIEKDEKKREQFIRITEIQLEKMNWLIQTLLKLSKLDAGTAGVKDVPVSAKEVLEDSVKPFLAQMDVREITLLEAVEDFTFRGDKNWSTEAFANIIKNCIEHMEAGGTLRLSTEKTTLYDAVMIEDDGCGIEEEDLPHIFERFYHGKNASKESVGIGLALAKTIFEKERGEITVSSESGVGTVFKVKFYKSII